MKILKSVALFMCIVVMAVSCAFTAAAGSLKITVSELTAVPGDEIAVAIDISENTGVMAMTFTLGYDTKVLTYDGFNIGIFNDYTVVDHPDRGYVSFVNCENQDRTFEGNIIVMKFTVNKDASAGRTPLTIMNIRPEEYGESMEGCFANWNKEVITPTIVNGGVTVGETCDNSGHKYGDWKVISKPLCEAEGVSQRSCKRCGKNDIKTADALGHSFEKNWTVDKAATLSEDGKMSRHCTRCAKTTDEVSFKADVPQDNNFENTEGTQVKPQQWPVLDSIDTSNEDNTVSDESQVATQSGDASDKNEDADKQNVQSDNNKKTPDTKLLIALTALLVLLVTGIIIMVFALKRNK